MAVDNRDNFCYLKINGKGLIKNPKIGASVAINGVCLTVVAIENDICQFDAMDETLQKTNIGDLVAGDQVNIEQPMKIGDELGGHWVLGHVDTTAKVISKIQDGENTVMGFQIAEKYQPLLVIKGSVAIDGISLTVSNIKANVIEVSLMPLTLEITTLGFKDVGDIVNIETDYLLKAVLKSQGKEVI